MNIYPAMKVSEYDDHLDLLTHVQREFNGKQYLIRHTKCVKIYEDLSEFVDEINEFHQYCLYLMEEAPFSEEYKRYWQPRELSTFVTMDEIFFRTRPMQDGGLSIEGKVDYNGAIYEQTVEFESPRDDAMHVVTEFLNEKIAKSLQTNSTMPDIEIKYV